MISSEQKRDSVKRDYDLIARQYGKDYGNYIEDLDIYKVFEKELPNGATILDLGAGTGRTYSYFNKKRYAYIGLDFSQKMKEEAYKIHGEFPYIIDDMINIKNILQIIQLMLFLLFTLYFIYH